MSGLSDFFYQVGEAFYQAGATVVETAIEYKKTTLAVLTVASGGTALLASGTVAIAAAVLTTAGVLGETIIIVHESRPSQGQPARDEEMGQKEEETSKANSPPVNPQPKSEEDATLLRALKEGQQRMEEKLDTFLQNQTPANNPPPDPASNKWDELSIMLRNVVQMNQALQQQLAEVRTEVKEVHKQQTLTATILTEGQEHIASELSRQESEGMPPVSAAQRLRFHSNPESSGSSQNPTNAPK